MRELPRRADRAEPAASRGAAFDEEALVALADSLKERGVLQPVLVRPLPGGTYELIAGERRWRAAQLAGLETVPAMVRPDDDAASLELALIENMAREDLNPLEEARACAALVEELGLTREEVGRRVGRSRVAVSNLLRLLDLPDDALVLLEEGIAVRGPRPGAADGARPRRAPAAGARGGGEGLVGPPDRGARPRGGRAATTARSRRARGAGSLHPDQLEAAERLGEAFGRALGADVRVTPEGRAATASSSPSTRSRRRSRWRSGSGSAASA